MKRRETYYSLPPRSASRRQVQIVALLALCAFIASGCSVLVAIAISR